MLQPPILVFELTQPPRFAHVHAAVLRLPAIVRLPADPVLPANLLSGGRGLDPLQDRDDLLFRVPLLRMSASFGRRTRGRSESVDQFSDTGSRQRTSTS